VRRGALGGAPRRAVAAEGGGTCGDSERGAAAG